MSTFATATVVFRGDTAALVASLKSAEQAMTAAGKRMQDIGKTLTTRLTLPILGVGGVSVHMAAQFDDSLRKMRALVGISEDQIISWRGQIRQMAIDFGSSANEAADALFFITSAGLRGSKAMDTLEAALKGSAIGLGETKTVADAATSAMNAYAKQGLTATRATEILAAAVREGKLEASNLAPVMGNLTGLASSLNIPFEDIAGTLAVFSRTGTDAAEGATSLRSIMSTLLGTSEQGVKVLGEVGLSLESLREVIKGPGGVVKVIRLLEERLGGNLEKFQMVIPNIRALRGAMNVLSQDSATVDAVLRGVANSVGFLDDALVEAEGPAHRLRQAWARLKDSFIETGDVLLPAVIPAITALSTAIRDAAQWFGKLEPETKRMIIASAALAAALGPLLVILGSLLKITALLKLSGLIAGFATLTPWVIAGSALVVGLGVILQRFISLKIEAAQTAAAFEDMVRRTDAAFKKLSFSQAVTALDTRKMEIAELEIAYHDLREKMVDANVEAERMRGTDATFAEIEAQRALATQYGQTSAQVRARIEFLKQQVGVLEEVKRAHEASMAPPEQAAEAPGVPTGGQTDAEKVAEAQKEFADSLNAIQGMTALVGSEFDATSAKASAYETVVRKLVELGVQFDAKVGPNGETLQQLADAMVRTRHEADMNVAAMQEVQNTMGLAMSAIQDAVTPLEEYERTERALTLALAAGVITWEQYQKGIENAKKVMEDAVNGQNEINESIARFRDDAIDAITEFAFTGKQAFAEFVRDSLKEIAKLIIRLEILNALKASGGSFFGIQLPGFQHGGFMRPGTLGVVGESGPELVHAGRTGMNVVPLDNRLTGAAGGEERITTPVSITVNAVDAQSVSSFFENNESLVSNAMLRAQQKSSVLRRRLR